MRHNTASGGVTHNNITSVYIKLKMSSEQCLTLGYNMIQFKHTAIVGTVNVKLSIYCTSAHMQTHKCTHICRHTNVQTYSLAGINFL